MPNLVQLDQTGPIESVVSALEDALEDAKNGELRNIAIIADSYGDTSYTNVGYENGFKLIGHLHHVQRKISERMSENA